MYKQGKFGVGSQFLVNSANVFKSTLAITALGLLPYRTNTWAEIVSDTGKDDTFNQTFLAVFLWAQEGAYMFYTGIGSRE